MTVGLLASPALPWLRGAAGSLRERVERAEATEKAPEKPSDEDESSVSVSSPTER